MPVDLSGAPHVPVLRRAAKFGALVEGEGAVLEREHASRILPRPGFGEAVVSDDLAVFRAVPKLVGDVVTALVGLGGAPVLSVVGLRAGRHVHAHVVEGEHAGPPVVELLSVGHAGVAQLPRFVDRAVEHLVSQLERQLALLPSLVEDVARQALHKLDRGQLDHAAIRLAPGPVEPEVAVAADGGAFQQADAQSLELLLADAPAINLQLGGRSIGQPESRFVVDLKIWATQRVIQVLSKTTRNIANAYISNFRGSFSF